MRAGGRGGGERRGVGGVDGGRGGAVGLVGRVVGSGRECWKFWRDVWPPARPRRARGEVIPRTHTNSTIQILSCLLHPFAPKPTSSTTHTIPSRPIIIHRRPPPPAVIIPPTRDGRAEARRRSGHAVERGERVGQSGRSVVGRAPRRILVHPGAERGGVLARERRRGRCELRTKGSRLGMAGSVWSSSRARPPARFRPRACRDRVDIGFSRRYSLSTSCWATL